MSSCRPCSRNLHREYQNGETGRNSRYLRKYGVTLSWYQQKLADQGGRCPICQRDLDDQPNLDHCHATGTARGILCGACNKGLGLFRDDPAALLRAVDYLLGAASPIAIRTEGSTDA